MCEIDPEVAAVWKVILSDDYEWLCETISNFEITIDNANKVIAKENKSIKELAFTTLLRNRVNHGGILAQGSGMLKNGENGKGIASRWYPQTLIKRINDLQQVRHKITFIECDGIEFMNQNASDEDAMFFIDPPYTASKKNAGNRLYNYPTIDHELLFDTSAKVYGDFLMTYDNDPNVKDMASRRDFNFREIAMKNTHHAKMTELLIGKHDLGYLCGINQ